MQIVCCRIISKDENVQCREFGKDWKGNDFLEELKNYTEVLTADQGPCPSSLTARRCAVVVGQMTLNIPLPFLCNMSLPLSCATRTLVSSRVAVTDA
jgi:hypothetical protein